MVQLLDAQSPANSQCAALAVQVFVCKPSEWVLRGWQILASRRGAAPQTITRLEKYSQETAKRRIHRDIQCTNYCKVVRRDSESRSTFAVWPNAAQQDALFFPDYCQGRTEGIRGDCMMAKDEKSDDCSFGK
jgi:hypothetical protein